MRFLFTYLLIYLASTSVDRAVINVNSTAGTAPPEPSLVSYSAPPVAATDTKPVPPDLSLQPIEPKELDNKKRGLIDLRLENLSKHTVVVPISRDGKKAYEVCGTHPLLKSSLHGPQSESGIRLIDIDLYGCDLFRGSTVTLTTGDWITITGISLANQTADKSPEATFSYSLDENQYSRIGDQIRVASRGLYLVRSAALKEH